MSKLTPYDPMINGLQDITIQVHLHQISVRQTLFNILRLKGICNRNLTFNLKVKVTFAPMG